MATVSFSCGLLSPILVVLDILYAVLFMRAGREGATEFDHFTAYVFFALWITVPVVGILAGLRFLPDCDSCRFAHPNVVSADQQSGFPCASCFWCLWHTHTSSTSLRSHNMVFTQSHGFVLGNLFGLPRLFAPLSRIGLPRRGHRLFGNVVSFW
ncbi:hypothetical protein MFFC18_47630 [Mariniblastus fucicola]|uniref:Uncharacterized protein n=1 Tax=Mariniblastus fucicola TaxID=980251 RepID=A0A5B9PHS0_9BACT|nr:hypothetical protein MFFC18_47630 [Mariniblastus fucicola]